MSDTKKPLSKEIIEAYEKYAPKNISLEQFAEIAEKDPFLMAQIEKGEIGAFSTFYPEIAKAAKKVKNNSMTKDDFMGLLLRSMDLNLTRKVALNFANLYADIISSDDDILYGAWCFEVLKAKQRQDLAKKIINAINKRLGIENKLDIKYHGINSSNIFVKNLERFLLYINKKIAHMDQYCRGYYDNKGNGTICVYEHSNFAGFISTLSHEYGHFIDRNYPDLGALGSQIAFWGYEHYSTQKNYSAQPTEISSQEIEYMVSWKTSNLLEEQAKKKPKLYAKAVKYIETRFAALKFKYRNLLNSLENAEKEYFATITEMAKGRITNYERFTPQQLLDIIPDLAQDSRVKKTYKAYLKCKAKIPEEYEVLQKKLEKSKELLKEIDMSLFIENSGSRNM